MQRLRSNRLRSQRLNLMPEGPIEVFDDCLDPELFDGAYRFLSMPIWAFGWASKAEDRFRYWHAHFSQSQSGLSAVAQLEADGHHAILNVWRSLKSGVLSNYELQACFASAHTYGCGSQYHTDGRPGLHSASAILYMHRTWQPEWGGELVFREQEDVRFQRSILPLPNRLVVQPPEIPHAVRSPSRDCPDLRISLVFRLQAAN